MSKKDNCNRWQHLCKFFCPDFPFIDDFDDDYEYESKDKKLNESIRDKLLTDEKYTFEEYLQLLELVTEKYRTSFNTGNGKYEIIFRERTYDERFNISPKKESEVNDDERE